MNSVNFHWKERYVYIFGIVTILIILFITPHQVPEGESTWFPYLSLSILLISSIICLINCFRKKEKEIIVQIPKNTFKHFLIGILFYGLFIFLIELVGFYILSVIFIIVMLYLLKVNGIKTILLSPLLTSFLLFILLHQLLGLRMPMGILN